MPEYTLAASERALAAIMGPDLAPLCRITDDDCYTEERAGFAVWYELSYDTRPELWCGLVPFVAKDAPTRATDVDIQKIDSVDQYLDWAIDWHLGIAGVSEFFSEKAD